MWGSAIFLSSRGRKHLAPDGTGGPRGSITRPAEYGRQSDKERRRMARAADAFAIQRDAQERHRARVYRRALGPQGQRRLSLRLLRRGAVRLEGEVRLGNGLALVLHADQTGTHQDRRRRLLVQAPN